MKTTIFNKEELNSALQLPDAIINSSEERTILINKENGFPIVDVSNVKLVGTMTVAEPIHWAAIIESPEDKLLITALVCEGKTHYTINKFNNTFSFYTIPFIKEVGELGGEESLEEPHISYIGYDLLRSNLRKDKEHYVKTSRLAKDFWRKLLTIEGGRFSLVNSGGDVNQPKFSISRPGCEFTVNIHIDLNKPINNFIRIGKYYGEFNFKQFPGEQFKEAIKINRLLKASGVVDVSEDDFKLIRKNFKKPVTNTKEEAAVPQEDVVRGNRMVLVTK